MTIKHIKVSGWENAIRGMRFPLNSEDKMDSTFENDNVILGPNDEKLCLELIKRGKDHRKFLRMIHVQMAVKMSMTWWSHFDTYKIGTTSNSRSKMHKFGSKDLTDDDFLNLDLYEVGLKKFIINEINMLFEQRRSMLKTNPNVAKEMWLSALNLLPNSYLQERMIDLNYEVLLNIYQARIGHKLSNEWNFFVNNTIDRLPYLREFYNKSIRS